MRKATERQKQIVRDVFDTLTREMNRNVAEYRDFLIQSIEKNDMRSVTDDDFFRDLAWTGWLRAVMKEYEDNHFVQQSQANVKEAQDILDGNYDDEDLDEA